MQMEAKLERSTSEQADPYMEEIKKQMPETHSAQSPRHGAGCVKLAHLAVNGGNMRRVPSDGKLNCLCSPTTHVGSFRCRLHRSNSNPNPNNNVSIGHRSSTNMSNLASAQD